MKGNPMRVRKIKEQIISIIALLSVFTFFVYLKMNPELNSISSNTQTVEMKDLKEEIVFETESDKLDTNTKISETAESIIQYTKSELKRAQAYLDRNWKPDHTINIAAWEYVSNMEIVEDEKVLKEIFDMEKNQVVNAIK